MIMLSRGFLFGSYIILTVLLGCASTQPMVQVCASRQIASDYDSCKSLIIPEQDIIDLALFQTQSTLSKSPELSSPEKRLIQSYSGHENKYFNFALRQLGSKFNIHNPNLPYKEFVDYKGKAALRPVGGDVEEMFQRIFSLIQVLQKLPPYNGTIFRFADVTDPAVLEKYLNKGEKITEYGFLSTSQSAEVVEFRAKGREGLFFMILSKTGRDIAAFSHKPGEKEILFSPQTRFLVVDVKQHASGKKIVILEEVN